MDKVLSPYPAAEPPPLRDFRKYKASAKANTDWTASDSFARPKNLRRVFSKFLPPPVLRWGSCNRRRVSKYYHGHVARPRQRASVIAESLRTRTLFVTGPEPDRAGFVSGDIRVRPGSREIRDRRGCLRTGLGRLRRHTCRLFTGVGCHCYEHRGGHQHGSRLHDHSLPSKNIVGGISSIQDRQRRFALVSRILSR